MRCQWTWARPLPESLDSHSAHDLIAAILASKEEPSIQWVRLLAQWAVEQSERVEELESLLDAVTAESEPDSNRTLGLGVGGAAY